jgi:hypothetical protein
MLSEFWYGAAIGWLMEARDPTVELTAIALTAEVSPNHLSKMHREHPSPPGARRRRLLVRANCPAGLALVLSMKA